MNGLLGLGTSTTGLISNVSGLRGKSPSAGAGLALNTLQTTGGYSGWDLRQPDLESASQIGDLSHVILPFSIQFKFTCSKVDRLLGRVDECSPCSSAVCDS